jgi:hypothetical protein
LTFENTVNNHTPAYAKLVMITETFVILFFTYWMYAQYTSDIYFQAYVNSLLGDNGLLLVIVGSIMLFAMIGIGFYARLHSTKKTLDLALENTSQSDKSGSSSSSKPITILEPHVEQHLIEMIRKNAPSDNAPSGTNTSGSMPVLKKENPSSTTS